MLRTPAFLAVCCCATAAVAADNWTDKLFNERSFDFGAVPRSAKVEHEFVITNPLKEDIHIVGVRASCGCTQPRVAKDTIRAGETGAIIAAFNTHTFTGQHGARLTVTIDRPQWTEVELNVKGYIRTDVTLEPGQVALGSIPLGQTVQKKIKIDHYGRGDWALTGVTPNSPYLSASLKELSRSEGHQTYELDVQLKEGAPVGYLNDELTLATNDRRAKFPVKVEGLIVAPLTVSPTTLMLGALQPGQKVTKQIVVKGLKPFKILEVRCENPAFKFAPSTEAKTVHLIPVNFQATRDMGKINQQIEILTDLAEQATARLSVTGQVNASLAGK